MADSAASAALNQAPRFIHQWRNAVLAPGSGLTSTQRLTLIALAQFADGAGGSCFPSSVSIAECAALSDKAVRIALESVCLLGWFIRTKRAAGKGKNWRGLAYEYHLAIPEGAERSSLATDEGQERRSAPYDHAEERGSDGQERRSDAAERRTYDLALDPEKKDLEEQEHTQVHACEDDLEDIALKAVEAFNTSVLVKEYGLPRTRFVRERTKNIKRSLDIVRALMTEADIATFQDFFSQLFAKCAEDPWLRGEGNYVNERCPIYFEYLTRPDVIEKVYDAQQRTPGYDFRDSPSPASRREFGSKTT